MHGGALLGIGNDTSSGSSEDAMPDDRTAAVLRLRLTESRSRTKKRVLSRIGML